MKFLTLRQPWASLVAVGAKTVETRPFSTQYRGPLAIHAGKARPECSQWEDGPFDEIDRFQFGAFTYDIKGGPRDTRTDDESWWLHNVEDDVNPSPMPLGAVVAVCDLVDVVPITPDGHCPNPPDHGWASHVSRSGVTGQLNCYWTGHVAPLFSIEDLSEQEPFGDFTPGRYAWLLDNVRPIEPVPMKGAQGLRDVPDDVLTQIQEALS